MDLVETDVPMAPEMDFEVVIDEDVGVILVFAAAGFRNNEFSSALLLDRLVCNLGVAETTELDFGLRSCLCCCCLSLDVLIVICFLTSSSELSIRLKRCLLVVLVDVDRVEVALVTLAGKGIRVGVFAIVREEDTDGF